MTGQTSKGHQLIVTVSLLNKHFKSTNISLLTYSISGNLDSILVFGKKINFSLQWRIQDFQDGGGDPEEDW